MAESKPINETLAERGKQYGEFDTFSTTCQEVKAALYSGANAGTLHPYHREAISMIAHKLARIVNGNPHNIDSWHDIAGYASLVEQIESKGVVPHD